MKEIAKKTKEDLLFAFSLALSSPDSEHTQKTAQRIYDEYIPARALLPEDIFAIVGKLGVIAYPKTGRPYKESGIREIIKILEQKQEQ